MDIFDLVEQGKVKRLLQVRNKIVFPGAIVHVTQRAAGKEPLFIEENDYLEMLHLIKEKSAKFLLEIFAFVLMPNHLHLLLRVKETNLAEATQSLFGGYAVFFNKKYERKGHLFCGPYGAALCFDESYLLAASLYIHINPVAAGLTDNPVNYKWSSCRLFIGSIRRKSFLKPNTILELLDNDVNRAFLKYRELLEQGIRLKLSSIFEDKAALEKFRINSLRYLSAFLRNGKEDNILDDMELDKRIEELRNKKRARTPQELKAKRFLIEQLIARGYTISDIATKLNVTRQSVYWCLNLTNASSVFVK
jgi:putative transposase